MATRNSRRRILFFLAALPAVILLGWKAASLLIEGWAAVRYPYQLDYGEGIVWQQMRSIAAGRGYGPLDGFPDIVFHYPPIYHQTTWLIAQLGNFDELATGRFVSLASTFIASAFLGLITARLVPPDVPRSLRLLGGWAATLMALSLFPVQIWAPVMRVDMLAIAIVLAGVLLSFHALERPRFVYLAAAAFVMAVYVKQSTIAAPAAVFLVLLVARPGLAVRGIGSILVLGLVPLVILTGLTDGGFPRHLFLYNINEFDPARLMKVRTHAVVHGFYLLLAATGLAMALHHVRTNLNDRTDRPSATGATYATRLLIGIVYLILASLMALLIAKSGSGPNYFVEWLSAACMFAGVGIAGAVHRLSSKPDWVSVPAVLAISLVIALQAALLPTTDRYYEKLTAVDPAEFEVLGKLIRESDRPVISDDMVLLLKNGREGLWESAIFTQLSGTGQYDLRPFIAKVRRRQFAFFVTEGGRGDDVYDLRYSGALADAIDTAYPDKRTLAGYVIHFPAGRDRPGPLQL